MRYGAKMQWEVLREVRHKDVCNGFLINQDVIECVCVCVCMVISGKYPRSAIQVLAFKSDTVCKQSNVYKQQGLT